MAKRIVARKYGGVKNSSGYPAPTGMSQNMAKHTCQIHGASAMLSFMKRRKHKSCATMEQLCMAIAHGEVDEALKIIKSGDCDINAQDASGNCPLHTALHYDQLDVVEALLAINCEVNYPEEVTKLYPIHIAAHKTSPDCLDVLLEYNRRSHAGTSGKTVDLNICDETSYNTALGLAARAGHFEIAERLVCAGCKIDTFNVSGECPLYLAVLNGHAPIVKLLLENGASLEKANQGRNESELLYSCLYSHDDGEVLRLLLEYGQNPNVFSAEGRTPLMYALTWEQHAMLQVLQCAKLKNFIKLDVATPDTCETALFMALRTVRRSSRLQYVRTLIQRGASVNHINASGLQPLDIAIYNNAPEAVELLLEAGARIRTVQLNPKASPPLIVCAQQGLTTVASLLVLYGAALNADEYAPGNSPLFTALVYKNLDIMELLIDSGCNVSAERWLADRMRRSGQRMMLPSILEEQPALHTCLQQLAGSPAWLSQLCRTTIRQYLQRNNVPMYAILDLQQPLAIKKFLLCTTTPGSLPSKD